MTPLVEVRALRFRYDDGAEALKGIDFRLDPGESVALLGANGSGKTTFVLHLNGLLSGGEGTVAIGGEVLDQKSVRRIRHKVGLVFQDSENQLFMPTVLEDVAFGPLNQGLTPGEAERRALEALAQTGMSHAASKAPYHLSSGEKKRVAIAGVLAMRSEILVLDEPTTFLDPPARQALLQLLQSLPQAKIIVTHDMPFAVALCPRALFFRDGLIAGDGPARELIQTFQWGITFPGPE